MSEAGKTTTESTSQPSRKAAGAASTNGSAGAHASNGAATSPSAGAQAQVVRAGHDSSNADFAAELHQFLASLLERQCRMTGAVAGVIYLAASQTRQASVGATFTLPATDPGIPSRALVDRTPIPQTARVALDQAMVGRLAKYGSDAAVPPRGSAKSDLITLQASDARGIYQPDPTHRILACPLVAADQIHGATVVIVPVSVRIDPTDSLERLALCGAAYEAFLWRRHSVTEAQTKTHLRETLELLDAAQQAESADAMGEIFCHELARRFGCTRVSIGLIKGAAIRVAAVSGADEVNAHAAVVESLEAVMEECADQDVEIVFPAPSQDEADPARRRVTRAHNQHSVKFGPAALLSLPLRVSGDLVGVVTLEREPGDPFPVGAAPLLRLVAEFIGPALWTRRMADRKVIAVTRDRALEVATLAVGPRHTAVKAVVVLLVGAFLAMAFVPIPGRVTADSETRAAISRTVPPPFSGFLESVHVKPGDRIHEGDPMATMDLKEAQLELEKARVHVSRLRTQQDDARNKGQHGDIPVIAAAIEESLVEIRLLEDRMAHGTIAAPISGTVSRGDIEPLAGAKVEPSQPLFEIVATDKQVVVLQIKERDIGSVKVGQEGKLALTALPDDKVPIRVSRIRPTAETVKKGNVYFVEADLLEDASWIKPGMTGTARLDNGWTTVLWELARPVVDEIRLRLWW